MADNRLASTNGRQAALDSGDLIPTHPQDGGGLKLALARHGEQRTSRRY